MVKEYMETAPEKIKDRICWNTDDEKEPVPMRISTLESTPLARVMHMPLKVAMGAKLQLPKSQGEIDPSETYDGIEQWPIRENITEDKGYDDIGSEGGEEVGEAVYVNAAFSELAEMIPKQARGRVMMYKEGVKAHKAEVERKYRGLKQQQWEDALEVVEQISRMEEEKRIARGESIVEKGKTIGRLQDNVRMSERRNFDNTKNWIVGDDAKNDKRATKQKIKEEKEAKRRWQEPYERKITLDGLMEEGLEHTM